MNLDDEKSKQTFLKKTTLPEEPEYLSLKHITNYNINVIL